jgi:hypothetical protein
MPVLGLFIGSVCKDSVEYPLRNLMMELKTRDYLEFLCVKKQISQRINPNADLCETD